MHLSFIVACSLATTLVAARDPGSIYKRAENIQSEIRARNLQQPVDRASSQDQSQQNRFLTNKTRRFAVDGKSVPDVDFDLGESYAGLLPISSDPKETRKLFFWFFPSIEADRPKEMPGTFSPVRNSYDWRNLTNVLWIEQPVGVGFTQGKSNISNEEELGQQFVGFYEQFVKTFDLTGWDVYLKGESYAGFYIPYIANEFINVNSSDMPLKGIAINDPIIGDETVQIDMSVQPFVSYWSNVLGLDNAIQQKLATQHRSCGYADYIDTYFKFPPPQMHFPPPNNTASGNNGKCDALTPALTALENVNPCFNTYHITDYCPLLWSVVGPVGGGHNPAPQTIYFNRTDVKKAIHAPLDTDWAVCASGSVFQGPNQDPLSQDTSTAPAQTPILQRVIEHTNNVIIGTGGLDFTFPTNGTLLVLQNTTWNGYQGFKKYPSRDMFVPSLPDYNQDSMAGSGVLGHWVSERGLTFYQVDLAGHEIAQYAPGAAFRVMELLLGIKSLGQRGGFT